MINPDLLVFVFVFTCFSPFYGRKLETTTGVFSASAPSRRPARLRSLTPAEISLPLSSGQAKAEAEKKQEVMTLSDSDDVQTISSGSDDNKEKEKVVLGNGAAASASL